MFKKEMLVLSFKRKDYEEVILACATELDIEIDHLIINAVATVNNYPNLYSNPMSVRDYSQTEKYALELSEDDFKMLKDKADYNGFTIEVLMIEAVQMYHNMYVTTANKHRHLKCV